MRKFGKRFVSATLITALAVSSLTLSGCGKKDKKSDGASSGGTITLNVYSQRANSAGILQGWSADLLKEKFDVELNIISDQDGVYETRMEEGDLGDIVVWGSDGNEYLQAVRAGLLYDWEEDDLLNEYGSYIAENMPLALEKNRKLTSTATDGESDTLYGYGMAVAPDANDHQDFTYNWDIRWDLYKELGYPEVRNLDDLEVLLKDMKEICPTDDSGKQTYGASLWQEWDGDMVMYVKSTGSAMYGYDELGVGLYDPSTGEYHDCLEKDGPYFEALKFYNNLYREGLLDPDSMTATFDQMAEKMSRGGVFFSIFGYAGNMQYNSVAHLKEGKMMYALKPTEASPIVYGLNPYGSSSGVISIGANTAYPELCMEIINYISTPEGRMNMKYGPEGDFWYYDEEGYSCLTDIGYSCAKDRNTDISGVESDQRKYSGSFKDGEFQVNFDTWDWDAKNPDSTKNETFNYQTWDSIVFGTTYDIVEDWKKHTGANTLREYFDARTYTLSPGLSFAKGSYERDEELETTWAQVTKCIVDGTWNAMYADSDAQYEKIVNKMIKDAESYGYADCLEWSKMVADAWWQAEQDEVGVTAETGTQHKVDESNLGVSGGDTAAE